MSKHTTQEAEKETTISWWITVPCSDTSLSNSFSFPNSVWEKLTEEERSRKIIEDIGEYFVCGDGKDYLETY